MEEVINKISLILRTAMQWIVFEPEVCFVERLWSQAGQARHSSFRSLLPDKMVLWAGEITYLSFSDIAQSQRFRSRFLVAW